MVMSHLGGRHEGNTEEKNNGNVVFKWNIHRSDGAKGDVGGEGGEVLVIVYVRPPPTAFYRQASEQIFLYFFAG